MHPAPARPQTQPPRTAAVGHNIKALLQPFRNVPLSDSPGRRTKPRVCLEQDSKGRHRCQLIHPGKTSRGQGQAQLSPPVCRR